MATHWPTLFSTHWPKDLCLSFFKWESNLSCICWAEQDGTCHFRFTITNHWLPFPTLSITSQPCETHTDAAQYYFLWHKVNIICFVCIQSPSSCLSVTGGSHPEAWQEKNLIWSNSAWSHISSGLLFMCCLPTYSKNKLVLWVVFGILVLVQPFLLYNNILIMILHTSI